MIDKLKTSLAFTKNIFVTGAVRETRRDTEIEICKKIPIDRDVTVVEFGMGYGNITKEILNTISKGSKVYAFEVKESFCDEVRKRIDDDRLIIVNDGAELLKKYVPNKIDAIIGTIPYSFFSKEKAASIVSDSYELLNDGCFYSQALYSKFHFKKFERVFDNCELKTISNIPPEYIYFCQKK